MKIVLFQILFTCLVAAKESACTINCPKIEMDKMYIVKACTGEGDNERCIGISQAGPGLDVKFDNDEEAILICVNGSRNTLKANTTIKITPNDQLTPNLLTIKTLDNLKSTVSISNDKSTILISLTPNTPEGKFVLQYNGEVDVKLDSVTANPPTQTYTFSSPLFVQTSDPVNTTVNNADFKLTDYAAICKLLCDYYCTATFICSHATFNEVNVDSFDLLSRLYEAECTRISIYNSYSSATKPKSVAPAKKILCLGGQKGSSGKCDINSICTPVNVHVKSTINIEICNMIAFNTLFDLINVAEDGCEMFGDLSKALCQLNTSLTVEEVFSVFYHIAYSYGSSSEIFSIYQSCISEMKLDINSFDKGLWSRKSSVCSLLKTHTTTFGDSAISKAEDAKESEKEEDKDDDASTTTDKPKSEGFFKGKGMIIVGVVVVTVIAVVIGGITFLT